jgi:hypothetical protein
VNDIVALRGGRRVVVVVLVSVALVVVVLVVLVVAVVVPGLEGVPIGQRPGVMVTVTAGAEERRQAGIDSRRLVT